MSSAQIDDDGDDPDRSCERVFKNDGEVDVATAQIAQLEAENQSLREENIRAQQILQSALDYAIITMDNRGCITGWNAGAQQILGYAEAEVLGRSGALFVTQNCNEDNFTLELCRSLEDGKVANDRWHVRRDGSRFWASGLMLPLLDLDGQPNGFLNILRDRSELQAQAEQRELLMAEMNHRVKNTFAMVQAVATQSSRHAGTLDEFQMVFGNRLAALAHSHDILIAGGWEDAPLRSVIEEAIRPFCSEPGRLTVAGTSVLLAAGLVVPLTLAFHELATNAAKHGALSVQEGTVQIVWQIKTMVKGPRQVELRWRERKGPSVRAPERKGFGSYLLNRGLRHLGGSVKVEFFPAGLECHICFPVGRPHDEPST